MPMTRSQKLPEPPMDEEAAPIAPEIVMAPAPAAPPPLLISDSQLANRHSFNFATKKTKYGMKCISLPAHDIAAELAKREPNQARVRALRDELLAFAVAEFHRWEARVA